MKKSTFVMPGQKFLDAMCVNHTGKMLGMISFSTSCKDNKICAVRAKNPNSICSHCFAQAQLSHQPSTRNKCARNGDFIKPALLPDSEIPYINAAKFRFESFGDLETIFQFKNYLAVAKKNPHCFFTLWTKNYFIVELAVSQWPEIWHPGKNGKHGYFLKNFCLVLSSPIMNKELNIDLFPYADKVFTVFSPDYIRENDITVNCGARNCLTCGRCYSKKTAKYVREQLK